jgi:DNA-binding LacI/PurR family transcriptional regulator
MFEQSHADGIIIIGDMQDDEYALQALTTQHRYVVGVTDRTSRRAFPGVYGDTVNGAQQALQHLWDLGHRRIACVSDPAISDGRRRIEVYKEFLRERGGEASTEVYEVARSFESGDQLGKAILSQPYPFTAIFATTDSLAIGLMKAAYALGILVPGQLSIIGYDDIAIAPFTSPPLTTISQFGHEMGRQTATLLLNMIEGELESADVADVILPTRLIVRDSTAAPNGA